MKRLVALICIFLVVPNFAIQSASALDPTSVASIFQRLGSNQSLANPAVIVIDEKTKQIVFEKNADSPRKPASILKLLSATAAYSYLEPTHRFTTSVWTGVNEKSIVIQGSLDPWISFNNLQATKMGRTSMPRIEYNSLSALKKANSGPLKTLTVYYSKLYSQDIANINSFFLKRGVHATFKRVTSQEAIDLSSEQIVTSDSPELQEILAFTLLWSDNLLAERIARLASVAAGHSLDDSGVSQTFNQVFNNLGIESNQLVAKDGSGLSRENQMTAKQIADLLLKIRENEKLSALIEGLPIGGVSGTLRKRFLTTAPQAVGLVRAKTGRLYDTANLAGYIESGDREYAFVVIADKLTKTNGDRARAAMDLLIGKIAAPLFPDILPAPTEVAAPTTI
jgi:D-alanyl-D-alanine carboxypeptidase